VAHLLLAQGLVLEPAQVQAQGLGLEPALAPVQGLGLVQGPVQGLGLEPAQELVPVQVPHSQPLLSRSTVPPPSPT
jgi:hypothetical protein